MTDETTEEETEEAARFARWNSLDDNHELRHPLRKGEVDHLFNFLSSIYQAVSAGQQASIDLVGGKRQSGMVHLRDYNANMATAHQELSGLMDGIMARELDGPE